MRKRKLGTRILTPVVVVTVIFAVVLYFLGSMILNRLIDDSLNEMVAAKVVDIESRQQQIADKMLALASLFSQNEGVVAAYEEVHKGDLKVADDPHAATAREMLRKSMAGAEKGYTSTLGVKDFRIHFHLPSSRSFLRLWKKDQSKCDDLSSFRETIKTIAGPPHQPLTGIEIGRGGFAIRGIAPIKTGGGKYLGSVEVLSSYTPLVETSIANRNETIAVYMNAEFLPIATRLQDAAKYPVKDGRFVRVTTTAAQVSDLVINSSLLEKGKSGVFQEYHEDYMLTAFPVRDYQKRQIGVMVYIYNAAERFAVRDRTEWGVALVSLALLISICLVLVIVLKSVTSPLVRAAGGLKEAADQVTSAAHEISSSSQVLAESSSEQAAAVEETGASVEDVASMARHNAENANSANTLSGLMDQATDKGKEVMGRMNLAVNEIKKSSDETAKIIKVIEEIAFQTNLLALNAAVEAARAGEAGAGFAVVADEVRNLAKRSAESAAETSALIQDSVSKADQGVELASEVDKVLGEVVGHVAKVKNLVAEIAAASGEQSEGISRITNAIGEIEKATQGNAATAEESAAASEELNAQAEMMREMTMAINAVIGGSQDGGAVSRSSADKFRPAASATRHKMLKAPAAKKGSVLKNAAPKLKPAGAKAAAKPKQTAEELIPFEDDKDDFDDF